MGSPRGSPLVAFEEGEGITSKEEKKRKKPILCDTRKELLRISAENVCVIMNA